MATPKGSKPWNAGTSKGWSDKRGYRWIYVTENGRRRAKREHRHVVEQHLGRKLTPEEVVHHRNGDPSDNRIENLEVMPFGIHTAEHHRGTKQAEQSRITQSVLAEYREEKKRLQALNADLLEALKRLESTARILPESMDEPGSAMSQARSAISRAEGRTEPKAGE